MNAFLESIGYNSWVLPALLLIPLVGAVLILILPSRAEPAGGGVENPVVRQVAFWLFMIEFVVSLGLWWSYNPADNGWQAAIDMAWIPTWGVRFTLGIDGIALMMVLLTTFIMPLAVLGSWTSIRTKVRSYYALLLILTVGNARRFSRARLVPVLCDVGSHARADVFHYRHLGRRAAHLRQPQVLHLHDAAVALDARCDHLPRLARTDRRPALPISATTICLQVSSIPERTALWLFAAFFLAFAVKVPMFPFHTWLPDAHVEAPTAGSVILASIMLKMGTFGFLRFALPLFPGAAMNPTVRMVILVLAVIGIIYGALVAMVQPDFKKLVAYSSVSHLGFVMLGIFALTLQSVQGALMIMINHGISTGALFLLVGMIYERRHTRLIDAYGGIARVVPLFAAMLTFVSLSSIGLPGTNGFVGEFLVLLGAFKTYPVLALIATTGVIFAAAYLLWAIQRILFNPLDKRENTHIPDLNRRELALLVPLVAVIIWLGVYPAPVLRRMEGSSQLLITRVEGRADAGRVSEAGRP